LNEPPNESARSIRSSGWFPRSAADKGPGPLVLFFVLAFEIGEKRTTGARRMRGADWGDLRVLRDLQKDVIGT
jgi:hypothetical protein